MRFPVAFTVGLATAFASLASAHTCFTTLFINDVNQGDGTCVRMPKDGSLSTHPIYGYDNPDLACGRDGNIPVAFTCPAPAGAKLTFEFRMWADLSQPGAIDAGHKGPIAVYLKRVSNITIDSAVGPGWFKIYEEGFDTATNMWAVTKLNASQGLLSINLPSGLPTSYYLIRTEMIALHNVTSNAVSPQPYVGCAQLFIQSSVPPETAIPSEKTVSIPGHLSPSDPGLNFNVYRGEGKESSYRVPGPAVYFPTAPPGNNKAQNPTIQQTDGLIPDNCLVKNANWCGVEVPRYTNQAGCWASAENCWNQLEVCYKTAPPSGNKGCRVWEEQKCKVLQQACSSGQWQGPPNEGQKLTAVVDSPIPGGKLPDPVNAGQQGEVVSGGGGSSSGSGNTGGGQATTFIVSTTSAVPTSVVTSSPTPIPNDEVAPTPTVSPPPRGGKGKGYRPHCKSTRKQQQRRWVVYEPMA
ncbi:uncharacterized protein CTHT_0031380 [Thermochaetoides thermophila DSM 1495]|uniref:lytic cellulose monooxygenase (C4-dehydrogenating) n=1 Tax=Chaetomium thermophilum (strain DSM 1495 / CBS 144.50 / IMI 039719) TaxID=759272 RepID=G0S4L0_CHATD|nr:hypothetical protein CTHT_0031380 [Thermochaetoides thermophila DSM 1495]EGS21285.1 hypothetical protein CTHT_0031380 [Thermochaetoides thermophila DSM 1495]